LRRVRVKTKFWKFLWSRIRINQHIMYGRSCSNRKPWVIGHFLISKDLAPTNQVYVCHHDSCQPGQERVISKRVRRLITDNQPYQEILALCPDQGPLFLLWLRTGRNTSLISVRWTLLNHQTKSLSVTLWEGSWKSQNGLWCGHWPGWQFNKILGQVGKVKHLLQDHWQGPTQQDEWYGRYHCTWGTGSGKEGWRKKLAKTSTCWQIGQSASPTNV
jgi:hypothetical protein